jgi:hypothetical protein
MMMLTFLNIGSLLRCDSLQSLGLTLITPSRDQRALLAIQEGRKVRLPVNTDGQAAAFALLAQ